METSNPRPPKPAGCTCRYPDVMARNSGHDESCPFYIIWADQIKLQQLTNRVNALEAAIRAHRDQLADDRCVEDDDKLYEVLGDGIKCDRRVGSKVEMLQNCARFIGNRCEEGHWPSYQELRRDLGDTVDRLEAISRGFFSTLIQNLRKKYHLDDNGSKNDS